MGGESSVFAKLPFVIVYICELPLCVIFIFIENINKELSLFPCFNTVSPYFIFKCKDCGLCQPKFP